MHQNAPFQKGNNQQFSAPKCAISKGNNQKFSAPKCAISKGNNQKFTNGCPKIC